MPKAGWGGGLGGGVVCVVCGGVAERRGKHATLSGRPVSSEAEELRVEEVVVVEIGRAHV